MAICGHADVSMHALGYAADAVFTVSLRFVVFSSAQELGRARFPIISSSTYVLYLAPRFPVPSKLLSFRRCTCVYRSLCFDMHLRKVGEDVSIVTDILSSVAFTVTQVFCPVFLWPGL